MKKSIPAPVYLIGIVAGIGAVFLSNFIVPEELSTLASAFWIMLLYGLLSLAAGFIQPTGRWHWGLAIALPLIAFVVLSVGFTGKFQAFIIFDAPILTGALVGAIIGGQAGSRLRKWTRQQV